jgi:hypothetical protein
MRKFITQKKQFLVILSLILVFSALAPVDLDAHICEYALIQCFGDANILDWLSKAIVGQLIYCLNGYDFCTEFIENFISK